MAYLAKSTILKAYKVLSSIDEDKRQGLTQKVSALKYGVALGMYYKQYRLNCDLKVATNKDIFASFVGRVVKINAKQCTKDFYTSIALNGRDYDCGSNFYSQSSVKDSKTNTEISLLYPKRSGWRPVMDVKDQVLIYNPDYIESGINFYLSSSLLKHAFVLWLLRFENIEHKGVEGMKVVLKELLTDEFCNALIPDGDLNYFQVEYNDVQCELIDTDIKYMFTGKNKASIRPKMESRQQIFYGVPGTGKSNTIKREVDDKGKKCFRTTFHPDSDYSTFVGCYKPSMKPTGVTLASKEKEEVITYKFVPQAFTRAYVEAWKTEEEVFLVIEEINRGNCAQIFGDLFQLLDRKDGVSEYPVEADTDLAAYFAEALKGSERDDIPEEVKSGEKLMLPSNLYIWATMNTCDQSLFPIDSAFKRRWEWKYIPIDTRKEEWWIEVEKVNYSWSSFLEIVNERVFKATSSEDKQLGFYFCKAQDNVISAETFVSKVLFYLWNDVFKDYDDGESIFRDSAGTPLPFSKFYNTDGSINEENVTKLLIALKVVVASETA